MKLKVCCIRSKEEAQLALSFGADVIGLVGPMPSGPGTILPEQAGSIVEALPGTTESFYLTSKTAFEKICKEYEFVRSTHIQLTDHTSTLTRERLRIEYPDVKIVQVVHVSDQDSVQEAIRYQEHSDYLLLDSGIPNKAIKELGGTGRTHDWTISRSIAESVCIPIFLAGGINSSNVQEAMITVKPFGIDLCSALRTEEILDSEKLRSFIKAMRP